MRSALRFELHCATKETAQNKSPPDAVANTLDLALIETQCVSMDAL
jgi:hypothetical protein